MIGIHEEGRGHRKEVAIKIIKKNKEVRVKGPDRTLLMVNTIPAASFLVMTAYFTDKKWEGKHG